MNHNALPDITFFVRRGCKMATLTKQGLFPITFSQLWTDDGFVWTSNDFRVAAFK
jgi:hypothetical protein